MFLDRKNTAMEAYWGHSIRMKTLLEIRKFNYSECSNIVSYMNNLYYFNEYTHFYNITKVYLSNTASENFENSSYSDTDIYIT